MLLLVPVLAAAAVAASAVPASSARSVKIGDNYFVRPEGVPTVTVSKGTTVKWLWTGRSLHNVKVVKGPAKFGSSSMVNGSYAKKVSAKGTYTIICTVHGAKDQKMRLVVK